MRTTKYLFIGMVAVVLLFSGLAPSAYAKHAPKAPTVHYKIKKNANPYAYLKPKKQKRPTGYYQSTLTGEMVYGKPKK